MVHGAIELAKELDDPDAFVVSLLCDWGERYLSKVYDDEWMRENGFLERSKQTTARDLIENKSADAPQLITVEPGTSVRIALSTITAHDIGQLPVVSDGSCVGSVTETSLMSQVIADTTLLDRPVDSMMGAPFPVIADHADSEEVRTLLTRGNAACLVSENGHLSGIITRYDVVRALTA
jgi:cystathionine beta-synthase